MDYDKWTEENNDRLWIEYNETGAVFDTDYEVFCEDSFQKMIREQRPKVGVYQTVSLFEPNSPFLLHFVRSGFSGQLIEIDEDPTSGIRISYTSMPEILNRFGDGDLYAELCEIMV